MNGSNCVMLVAGRVQCSADELTVNNGERVDMTCSLQYGGSADASWQLNWQRSDSEEMLASFVDDSENSAKRSYLLVARHKQSDGDYVCLVKSRHPPYNDSCTTHLHVTCKSAFLLFIRQPDVSRNALRFTAVLFSFLFS